MEGPLILLDSPALAIFCELERDGFAVQLEPGERIVITPGSRLTPDRMVAIVAHKLDLKLLLRYYDAGVSTRRAVMRKQIEGATPCSGWMLLYRRDVPYVPGICFSCGDSLANGRFGRCWRCSLAWRLAAGVPVPAAIADALDAARLV
jgi:hypothetical protein